MIIRIRSLLLASNPLVDVHFEYRGLAESPSRWWLSGIFSRQSSVRCRQRSTHPSRISSATRSYPPRMRSSAACWRTAGRSGNTHSRHTIIATFERAIQAARAAFVRQIIQELHVCSFPFREARSASASPYTPGVWYMAVWTVLFQARGLGPSHSRPRPTATGAGARPPAPHRGQRHQARSSHHALSFGAPPRTAPRLTPNSIDAARDPRGFRPLVMGRIPGHSENHKHAIVFASETCAFDLIGAVYELK